MTELVEVEIIGQAITAQYGTLNTGDILRTSAEFAKHLVDDCGAAKYRIAPAGSDTPALAAREASSVAPGKSAKPNKSAPKLEIK